MSVLCFYIRLLTLQVTFKSSCLQLAHSDFPYVFMEFLYALSTRPGSVVRSPNSMLALSSRVVVCGLSATPQYNGLEGVVVTTVNDSRIGILLDKGNKSIRLKVENVRPLLATASVFATGHNIQKSVCILFG